MSPTKATKKAADDAQAGAAKKDKAAAEPIEQSTPGSGAAAANSKATTAPEGAESEASEGKTASKKERGPSSVQLLARELIEQGDLHAVVRHLLPIEDEREAPATAAARLVLELSEHRPELLVGMIERFARMLVSKHRRVVASSAAALAPLSRIAPAKVAKQLPLLTQNWEHTTDDGKDGLVRTFAGLCTASVAYQKRLEPALARALREAEPKTLARWTEIVLPALKGEPHARARAVVEGRLSDIPRPIAQKIADFLGIKLRPVIR